jgi:hypothetical protein
MNYFRERLWQLKVYSVVFGWNVCYLVYNVIRNHIFGLDDLSITTSKL